MPRSESALPPSRLANALVAAAIGLAAFGYFAVLAHYGLNLDDEGTLLYQIYRTYVGQLLYVDFHAGYTPGIFYANAALFSAFGVNAVVLRLGLAVVNATTVLALYILARRLGTRRLPAAAAGMCYLAFIPFYDGQFAAFNIPYPIWYVTLFWLLAVLCLVAWVRRRRPLWCLLAGLCAGVVFSFKPNSGLLCLGGVLIAVVRLQCAERALSAGRGRTLRLLAFAERGLRWAVPLALAVALAVFYGRGAGGREVMLFALPLLVFVAIQIVRVPPPFAVRPLQLWRDLILIALGFTVVVLPWSLYFWEQLGTRPFLRAILFVGTGFDKFYYLPHPALSGRALLLAAALVGVAGVAALLRRQLLPRALVLFAVLAAIAAGTVVLFVYSPGLIEGLQATVVLRVREVAFVLVLAVEWGALVAYGRMTRRSRPAPTSPAATAPRPRLAKLAIILVSALLMHMQLYPRSDYMHLVPACPLVLVLGAWLLDRVARWASQGLAESEGTRAWFAGAITLPVFAVLLVLAYPALRRIAYLERAWRSGDSEALVRLDSPRAPLVIEPGGARMIESLNAVTQYLVAHTRLSENVFTFPVLDMLCFLSGRHNPTRHGYFFPGWPGHAVEAEVIDALQQRPPRYIVTLHNHSLYFANAPIYYFNLRRYVLASYRLEQRLGLLDVLRYGPEAAAPSAAEEESQSVSAVLPAWRAELKQQAGATARRLEKTLNEPRVASVEGLAETLAALDPRAQRRLALLVRKSRSTAGVAAFARVLAAERFGPLMREVANRMIAEIGDAQSLLPLLPALQGAAGADREMFAGLLYNVSNKLALENYWYGAPQRRELARIADAVDDGDLIQWIDNPWEGFALRSFAIRMAARLGHHEIVPFLARVLGDADDWPDLRVQAAQSLYALGYGAAMLDPIVGLLERDIVAAPALAAEIYPSAPAAGRRQLLEAMQSPADLTRSTAFWIAAGVHDPEVLYALIAGLSDPVPDIRIAAAWGLGHLGDGKAMPALQQAMHDPNDEVARAAAEALRRLEAMQSAMGRS